MLFCSIANLICSIGAEIGVMVSEAIVLLAGGAFIFVLARKLKPPAEKNKPVVLPDLSETRPVCADVPDKLEMQPSPEQKSDDKDEEKAEVETPQPEQTSPENPSDEKEESEAQSEPLNEQNPEQNAEEENADRLPEQEPEQNPEAQPEEPAPVRRSAAEIFAKYEKEAGIEIDAAPAPQPDRHEQASHEQDVLELKRYMQSLKESGAGGYSKPQPQQPVEPENEYVPQMRANSEPENNMRYIDPANPDKPRDENFASYNQSDSAELRRHIEQERKRHEAIVHAEQEKVDWDKVKQYNSAILSMGEIKPDDDRK